MNNVNRSAKPTAEIISFFNQSEEMPSGHSEVNFSVTFIGC